MVGVFIGIYTRLVRPRSRWPVDRSRRRLVSSEQHPCHAERVPLTIKSAVANGTTDRVREARSIFHSAEQLGNQAATDNHQVGLFLPRFFCGCLNDTANRDP